MALYKFRIIIIITIVIIIIALSAAMAAAAVANDIYFPTPFWTAGVMYSANGQYCDRRQIQHKRDNVQCDNDKG